LETLRGDADHREQMPVDCQRSTDDRWILVKTARPEAVAQHRDRASAGLLAIARAEEPPDGRDRAEDGERVGRDERADNAFRPRLAARIAIPPEAHRMGKQLIGVDAFECGRASTDVQIVGVRACAEAAALSARPDVDEAIGFEDAHGRPEEESVSYCKDRGVRAYTDRERQRRRQRKERIAPQQPDCVPQISPRIVEPYE